MTTTTVPPLTAGQRAELHKATELTSLEVCALAGATFRQVDYWTREGALKPLRLERRWRRWSRQDAAAVWAAIQLLTDGRAVPKLDTVRALQAEFRAGHGRYLVATEVAVGLHETAEDAVAALHGRAGRILPLPTEWLS